MSHSSWSHRLYILHIYPVCNSRVVIDHTFMTISLNLENFQGFVLLETLTSLGLPFHLLCWLKCVLLRLKIIFSFQYFFLTPDRIRSETLNIVFLFSETYRLPNSSPPQKVSEAVHDLFILMDSVITNIHYRCKQPPLSLIMPNVIYLIREMFAITLRNLLKQDLTHTSNTLNTF